MTRPVTAMCDHCGKITDVDFKEQRLPNDIRETYFKCEHCYYHYTSFVTDKRVRKLQGKRDSLQGIQLAKKRQEIQEEINQHMSMLKYNLVNFGRADL